MKINRIDKILDIASIVFLSIMFILVVLQVVMRYVFKSPLIWSEELARYSMVWLVFVGSIVAMKSKEHIDITILFNYIPKKLGYWLIILSKVISLLFLALVVYYGVIVAIKNFDITSPVVGIPMVYVQSAIPIGALGMMAYMLKNWKEE